MSYFSTAQRNQLNDWVMASAKKIGRRVVGPSVSGVFGPEDGEIVAMAKMLALAEAGCHERPLLYSAGYRAAVDAVRQVATRNGHDFIQSLTAADGTSAEIVSGTDEVGGTLQRLMLDEMLDTLSPRNERIIRALYLDGKTEREVADAEGVTHERIHQVKVRSLALLRQAAENNPK